MNEFGNILENASLKNYNTYKIDSKCKYLIFPKEDKILDLIKYLNKNKIKYVLIGNGSNVILKDSYYDFAFICLKEIENIEINDDIVKVSSGVMLSKLNKELLDKGYINFSSLASIPGTIGGAIYGNAGCLNHDIFEDLISINVIKEEKIINLKKEDISYSYRNTNLNDLIIINAIFKIRKGNVLEAKKQIKENLNKRLNTQPIDKLTSGSVFKNPQGNSSGKLIEEAGLKGYVIGGAKISEKHANFIENYNNATGKDILNLIELIKNVIKDKYNIYLELEQKII